MPPPTPKPTDPLMQLSRQPSVKRPASSPADAARPSKRVAPSSASLSKGPAMLPPSAKPRAPSPITQSSNPLGSLKRAASSPAQPARASKLLITSTSPIKSSAIFAPGAPDAPLTDFIRCAILNFINNPQFLHDNPVNFPYFPLSPLATSNSPAEDEVLSDRFFFYSAAHCEELGLDFGGQTPAKGGFFAQIYTGNSELQGDEDKGNEGEKLNEEREGREVVNLYTVGIDACLWDEDVSHLVERYKDLKLYGERKPQSASDHVVLEFSFRMKDAEMEEIGYKDWKTIVRILRDVVAEGFTSKGDVDSEYPVMEVNMNEFGTVRVSSIVREGIRRTLGFPASQVQLKARRKVEERSEEDVDMGGL